MRRRLVNAGWWAVAVSLAAHLLVIVWALERADGAAPPAAPPPALQQTTLVWFDADTPRPDATKDAPPEPAESPPARQPAPAPIAAAPRPSGPRAAPQHQPTEAAGSPDAPVAVDAPRRPGAPPLLVPKLAPGPSGGSEPTTTEAARPPSTAEVVDALARDAAGRGRVERGLVHSYFGDLGRALLAHWDATPAAKASLAENSKLYGQLWADRAGAWGRGDAPVGSKPTRAPAPNERIQGLQGVDLEARRELSRALTSSFSVVHRALIRVVQASDGRLLRVELVEGSSDRHVDQQALDDVRAAARSLPPPPAELASTHAALSSLWSFELVVSVAPPVPVVSFEFDEALGTFDPRLPLDRRVYKKVRLVSVE